MHWIVIVCPPAGHQRESARKVTSSLHGLVSSEGVAAVKLIPSCASTCVRICCKVQMRGCVLKKLNGTQGMPGAPAPESRTEAACITRRQFKPSKQPRSSRTARTGSSGGGGGGGVQPLKQSGSGGACGSGS